MPAKLQKPTPLEEEHQEAPIGQDSWEDCLADTSIRPHHHYIHHRSRLEDRLPPFKIIDCLQEAPMEQHPSLLRWTLLIRTGERRGEAI